MGYTLYYAVISMGTHTTPPIVDGKLGRDIKGAKCPAVGTNKEDKCPTSRIVPNQHYSSVHSLYNRVVSLSAF